MEPQILDSNTPMVQILEPQGGSTNFLDIHIIYIYTIVCIYISIYMDPIYSF